MMHTTSSSTITINHRGRNITFSSRQFYHDEEKKERKHILITTPREFFHYPHHLWFCPQWFLSKAAFLTPLKLSGFIFSAGLARGLWTYRFLKIILFCPVGTIGLTSKALLVMITNNYMIIHGAINIKTSSSIVRINNGTQSLRQRLSAFCRLFNNMFCIGSLLYKSRISY